MSVKWSELLERNRLYAKDKHESQPFLVEADAQGLAPPAIFVFSCMDPRAPTEAMLGLQRGQEAFLVRNLGGRVKGSLSSLLYLEVTTDYKIIKEIAIIHHTDCGLTHFTNDAFHTALKNRHPDVSSGEIDAMEVGTYDGSDLAKHKESIAEDIRYLQESELVRDELKNNIHGYLFDIKTGELIPMSE